MTNITLPENEKGIVHLALPLILLLVIGAVVIFALVFLGVIKNPFGKLPFMGQQPAKVTLKSEYKNPFDKKTQYVNPFETYKNPFVVR